MAGRGYPWIGLAALLALLAGCADRPVQTAGTDHAARASTGCITLRPSPPFASARSPTVPTHTDAMTRC
jgi:hypothetical protein